MPKYKVTETDGFGSTRVFQVESRGELLATKLDGTPYYETLRADVWVDNDGKCACTNCSGPLTAMKSSCEHCNAVRRHLKKEAG